MTIAGQTAVQAAYDFQKSALTNLQLNDIDGAISDMQQALGLYEGLAVEPATTIFFDDFEGTATGWTHRGIRDEWERGTPTCGPTSAYSGHNCWGTDLDDTYENEADSWLMSPPVDLSDRACAFFSFWVWNWVQDETQGFVHDPLWLDITTDGETYEFLGSHMCRVNDDPVIPHVGGWTRVVLDLTRYLGGTVQIRFRFASDADQVQYGSFIDDVRVYGIGRDQTLVEMDGVSTLPVSIELRQNHPNPFNVQTAIAYRLAEDAHVRLSIFNVLGQKIRTLVDGPVPAGRHHLFWLGDDQNGAPVSSGMYFCRLQVGDVSRTTKMLLFK